MDKKMICVEKPSQYNNQLLFNLDASDSSNYGNVNRNPGVIVIEKIQRKPPHRQSDKPDHDDGNSSLTSEKLALAIKLAKLDISNSKYEVSSAQHRSHHLRKLPKPARPRIKTEYVTEQDVVFPEKRIPPRRTKPTQHKVAKLPQKRPKAPRKTQFYEPPTFEEHIRGIVKRDKDHHSRHIDAGKLKDVCTSTADLNKEIASYAEQSDFKQFAKTLQTVVKKEKLRKRRNNKAPNHSGFLSLHRSPSKYPIKSPYRQTSAHFKSKHYQFSPKRNHESSNTQTPPVKMASLKKPTTKFEHSGNDISSDDSFKEITRNKSQPLRTKSPVRALLKNLSGKKSASSAFPRKPDKKSMVESLFDDIVEDTAVEFRKMDRNLELEQEAHNMNNAGTYETLLQRIEDMENEERGIRARWKKIKYDDIDHGVRSKKDQKKSDPLTDPKVVNIAGGDLHATSPGKKKMPYKFVTDKKSPKHERCSKQLPQQKSRTGLTLKEESLNSICKYQKERQNYLQACFHQPKGRFDPWKIVKDLSNEIMSSIMTSVCSEVNDICETCVDQIFEGEFAEPNHSDLFSDFSKNDDSIAISEGKVGHGVSFR